MPPCAVCRSDLQETAALNLRGLVTLEPIQLAAVWLPLVLVETLALWLGGAYLLEFRGARVHAALWGLSLAFFLANVDLVLALVDAKRSRDSPSRRH